MKHTQKFAFKCHKKCFGISDRFIRSKDTSPLPAPFFHIQYFFSSFSPTPLAALALECAGLLTSTSKKTLAVKNRTDLWWTCALSILLWDSVGPSGKRLQLRLLEGGGGGGTEQERGRKRSGEETLSDQSVASWSYAYLIRRHGLQSATTRFDFTHLIVLRCSCLPHHLPPQWR